MPPASQRSTAYSMYSARSFLPPPGPGAYQRGVNDSTLMLGDRAKAFHGDGFDQSRALLKERTGRPSPCDYSPSTLRSGRGLWSGRSSSIGLPLLPPPNRNPGPGEYSPMRPRAVGKSFGYTISRRDFSWDLPDLGGGYGSRGPAMLWRGEELRCARARACRK
ncbi:hypothetical protein EMIHUDRAFT_196949 [Emiliania huxleyi CCMP1516]|uniref:Uncharacterized protein n=2 Tax=Emiliania huxleyi TaxID=2903 RepID=A0A0D3ITG3_EMIH1|nr:hypothetical protein EMIHUDRAFT_196949 [Emiliania huxleyi CCMP1516]EOD14548.1 hypothetical protein EMIHUDRAFT_196949 [Emiliania huxleyi CCMP1516]|eukprot:XP_005766977.1 hypothetical protein EMIHUDRAFT_196949 [Emiliania huxleyi CCMP1516]